MASRTETCYVIVRAEKRGGLTFRVAKRSPRLTLNEFALRVIIRVPDSFWGKVYQYDVGLAGDGGLTPEVTFQGRDASGKFVSLTPPPEES